MAFIYGIEQDCNKCRMCGNGKGGNKITNFQRIKEMSVEELAEFLCKVKSDYQWEDHEFPSEDACGDWEEWLESECDAE